VRDVAPMLKTWELTSQAGMAGMCRSGGRLEAACGLHALGGVQERHQKSLRHMCVCSLVYCQIVGREGEAVLGADTGLIKAAVGL
jgi:hypothetical protein